jgi:hypothetical protein
MNTHYGRYALAAAAAALLSTTPHRADAQAPPGTVVSGTSGLQEIVVTRANATSLAQRTIAVNAYTAADIRPSASSGHRTTHRPTPRVTMIRHAERARSSPCAASRRHVAATLGGRAHRRGRAGDPVPVQPGLIDIRGIRVLKGPRRRPRRNAIGGRHHPYEEPARVQAADDGLRLRSGYKIRGGSADPSATI